MIARISGAVLDRSEHSLIIDVGGVGYRVNTTPLVAREGPNMIALWTYLAVRETALDLYGFPEREDTRFFELLLSVSGIGPKSALGILSLAPASALKKSIARRDATHLQRIHGVSKKIAEKLVLELAHKVGVQSVDERDASVDGDVIDAIISLGYSAGEARVAVQGLPPATDTVESRLKEALKKLGS